MGRTTRISKDRFLTLLKKGWEELGYAIGLFLVEEAPKRWACAIGAAAWADGKQDSFAICEWAAENLSDRLWNRLADVSNAAGSKEAAIRAIEAIDWDQQVLQ